MITGQASPGCRVWPCLHLPTYRTHTHAHTCRLMALTPMHSIFLCLLLYLSPVISLLQSNVLNLSQSSSPLHPLFATLCSLSVVTFLPFPTLLHFSIWSPFHLFPLSISNLKCVLHIHEECDKALASAQTHRAANRRVGGQKYRDGGQKGKID